MQRKKELDSETIAILNKEYIELFNTLKTSKKNHYKVINNLELGDTLNLIMSDMIAKVA